jgi:hypothetical protein
MGLLAKVMGRAAQPNERSSTGAELRNAIERRAWEIMRELQWVPAQHEAAPDELPLGH